MALPKEPRQKMINLMYLVLTAMLALNVSAEILNAFKTVDASLQNSNSIIDAKNAELFKSFQEKIKDEKTRERAVEWNKKAEQAKTLSDGLSVYIDSLKQRLKRESGLEIKDGVETYREDETNAPTRIMIEANEPQGKVLYDKLEAYRKAVLDIDGEIKTAFEKTLPIDLGMPKTENKANRDWSSAYFRMTPTIAAVTILSKFQNDVKNSEAQIVEFCHRKVGDVAFVIDQYAPLVGQSSNYLMPGQELTITAGIGAFNKEAKPSASGDGLNFAPNASGILESKFAVGGTGEYTKNVVITYTNQSTGAKETKSIPIKYTVGSPTGINVSADAVKVLYIGLTNPISITGGAKGAESIQASIDQGNIVNKGGGHYDVTVNKPGLANISVTADGKTVPYAFKVKSVPDPVAKVGQSKGGPMQANDFKAQFGVRADLENFVFENVKFNITGFTIIFNGAGFPQLQFRQVNGDSFDGVRNLIENCRPGTTVVIDEIRASGPGGTRQLPPIAFNLR